MTSETKIALSVFVTLVAVVGLTFFSWRHKETTRPILLEVRIVTATAAEPVFREGWRSLDPDEEVGIACAIRLGKPNEPSYWIAPVDELMIDGHPVEHVQSEQWPEDDRFVRAIWFTIESEFLGGDLTSENYSSTLDYRPFLAQEMGRELRALAPPTAHNDDYLGTAEGIIPTEAGTIRLYARVEVVDSLSHINALQALSSPGVENLPALATLSRHGDFPEPISDVLGEYFLLPCWQAEPTLDLKNAEDSGGQSFEELIEARLAINSASFAAIALSGSANLQNTALEDLGIIKLSDDRIEKDGRALEFGKHIQTGDILKTGNRWLVVAADDGDLVLGPGDRMLSCWRAPATQRLLGPIITPEITSFEHLRFVREQ